MLAGPLRGQQETSKSEVFMKRAIACLVGMVSVCLFLAGCGSSGGDSPAPTTTTGTQLTVQTGLVRLVSVLARTVPSQVTHFRVTGFDANGAVRFGPETVTKAATVEFTIPTTVNRLQVEYLAGTTLVGLGSTSLTVEAGQTTELSNLPFQDVESALTSLAVTPNAPSLAAGTSQQLTATATFADGSQGNLSSSVTWTSSATNVVTVSGGQLQAVAPGQSTVTASFGTVSTQVQVTVTAATLNSVTVSPNPISLGQGTTQQLTATANFSDGSSQDVSANANWTSSATGTATVNASGLLSAVAPGQTTVTASFMGQDGTASAVVTSAALTQLSLTPPNPSLATGTAQQLTATGTFSDGTTQNLTSSVSWSSDQTGVANVGPTGLVTGVAAGSAAVSASFQGVTGQTAVSVSAATVTSLSLTPANPALALGTTQQLTATAQLSDGSQQNVTASASWTSGTPAIASVNSSGLATAASQGQASINASFAGASASTTLTVSGATVTSLTVNPPTGNLAAGTQQQLTAIANFSDGSQQNVTSSASWTSSAASATVTPQGLVSAVSPGAATVSASFGGSQGSSNLNVTASVITAITVTPNNSALAAGTNQQFTALATLSDGSQQDVTSSASWSSATPATATVNASGLGTALAAGQTQIQATVSGISGNTTLTVTPASVTSLTVTPNTATITDGLFQQLTATATFSDGTQQDVSSSAAWSSDAPAVALVTATGAVIGRSPGNSTVSVQFGGQSASASITVTAATVSSIRVTPATPVLADGTTQAFTAVATFSDFTQSDITASAIWTSGTPGVASVNTSGMATALTAGQSLINATFGGTTGSATLTVTPATVTSIVITANHPSQPIGIPQQFTATANLSDGRTQNITSNATWTSANTSIATVAPGGVAQGVSVGLTDITASFGGVSGSTGFNVNSPTVLRVLMKPTPIDPAIANGTSQQFELDAAFSNGSTVPVTNIATWTSSNPAVATVDTSGLATAATPGQTVITGTFGGFSQSQTLTVTGPAVFLQSIAVEPPLALSSPGSTRQYRALGTYSDSSTQDLTSQVVWSSSNAQVTVANNNLGGNRVGRAQLTSSATTGTMANIQATLGTVSGSSTLRINRLAYINEDNLTITAFAVDAAGTVSTLGTPFTLGANPNDIEIEPSGRWLYAGTSSATDSLIPLTIAADGSLSANGPAVPILPFGPNGMVSHPNGEILYVLDSALQVLSYRIGTDGRLTQFGTAATDPAANGANHLSIHPNGQFLYVTAGFANTVSVFSIASDGSVTFVANTASGDMFPRASTVDPTGRYLYVANFVESIARFTIAADGTLILQGTTPLGGGVGDPTDVQVDPSGRFLLVSLQNSSRVVSFSIGLNGALTQVSNVPVPQGDARSVRVDSTGRFVYVAEGRKGATSFSLSSTGVLTLNNSVVLPRQPRVFVPTP